MKTKKKKVIKIKVKYRSSPSQVDSVEKWLINHWTLD